VAPLGWDGMGWDGMGRRAPAADPRPTVTPRTAFQFRGSASLVYAMNIKSAAPRAVSPIRRSSRPHMAGRTATPPRAIDVYDETVRVLKSASSRKDLARTRNSAQCDVLMMSRRLERFAKGPSVEALMTKQRAHSHESVGAASSDGSPRRRPSRKKARQRESVGTLCE
jgi:uncharacterized protein